MKKNFVIMLATVFVCLVLSYWTMADVRKDLPVAVSPGSEQESSAVSEVGQVCPTFSWSSVDNASSYRVTVFMIDEAKVPPYEEMAAKISPVLSKDIPGPALSWTLSSEEGLKTGNMYAWYVQALDSYGNAASGWSKGRIFKVKQEAVWVGIEEKLGQKLKEYGVNDEVIKNVLNDINSEVKEVVVSGTEGAGKNTPGISGILGTEGQYNTFYGQNAGAVTLNKYDTFIGANAGATNGNGLSNSFLGYCAGYANTSGSYNNFLGTYSGRQNTTGSRSLFLGYAAGYNSNGSDNIFLGHYAGYGNSTGVFNIFIGPYTGYYNSNGGNNIFLGYNAGGSNISGNYNTFIGNLAGYTNTAGGNNTFIGEDAGYFNTANYNTFIGSDAGFFNSGAEYNTFIGQSAGHFNSSGGYNTFVGKSAGLHNTSGFNNVYVGSQAGSDNQTGTGNICLGNQAGANELGSNKLYIMNNAAAFPLIYGDFLNGIVAVNGKLGIGVQAPTYPVHMASGAYCSIDGVWTDASSRNLKENIQSLSTAEALDALNKLNPVTYNYKADKTDSHVGFIAEDVPDLVATADRKGMSPMDVTAVLTKVVQELRKENEEYRKLITELQERLAKIEKNK